jgi:tetratricopeptide (TPR) repeat protein
MRQALGRISTGAEIHQPSEVSAEDRQRLAALGYVGTGASMDSSTPGERLPDPKDKVEVLERYREATELAGRGEIAPALARFRQLVADDPGMTDVWAQYARVLVIAGDLEGAVAAYREILNRVPTDSGTLLAAASALLQLGRLDEARQHAELAVNAAPAGAHETLARIAIAAKDAPAARHHAAEAQKADPTLPMAAFVEGLLLHREQRYADALPHLLAAAEKVKTRTVQIDDLHYHLGDALARLERYADAEPYFRRELAISPQHARARASLAMLYRAMGREQASDAAIETMLREAPSAESYRLAAELWTMFGQPQRAARTRAEAQKRFRTR